MAVPLKTTMTEVDNLPGREVEFTIGDSRWIMQTLADLYSNKEGAITREYSTNARDAHIDAGKADVPIEVTLPTLYDPYFVVQDFGIGMSEETLFEVYTKFGDSTKRTGTATNGMLGLGSKSAVAYTNQFTVEAIKDGVKTIAVISRRPDYSITLKVVSKTATDAGNGVKVTIPVHNHAEFAQKARDFYRFWEPGTVLVDGHEPKRAVGEKINDNLYYSSTPGTSYVVMNNVGYRIANPQALFRNINMQSISFVAYVGTCECDRHAWDGAAEDYTPHSAVEFTPSREDLKYTDHTKATLQKVISDFEEKVLTQAKAEITNAVSAYEAWTKWTFWSNKLGLSYFKGMHYKEFPLVSNFSIDNALKYKMPNSGYNSRYNTERAHSVSVELAGKALFVTDFLTDINGKPTPTADHKRKVRAYVQHVGIQTRTVYFIGGKVDSPWIPKENIISWEDLKAKLPKAPKKVLDPNRPRRPKGLFDYYTNKGKHYEKEIPKGADLFYVSAQDAKAFEITAALTAIKADDAIVVVILASNRIEKFKRDNFAVRDFVEWAKKKVVKEGETLLDDRAKKALNIGHLSLKWVRRIDETKIADPEWAATKELSNNRQYTDAYTRNLELARALGMRYHVKEWRGAMDDNSLVDKYPLLSYMHNTSNEGILDEIITYINAAYAAKKGKP